jgi:hypothetical protein
MEGAERKDLVTERLGSMATSVEEGDTTIALGGTIGKRSVSSREERAGAVLMAIHVVQLRRTTRSHLQTSYVRWSPHLVEVRFQV